MTDRADAYIWRTNRASIAPQKEAWALQSPGVKKCARRKMFFYFSKIIGFFLVPSNFLGLLFLSSLLMLWKRTASSGRVLAIAGAVTLLVLWLFPVGELLLAPLEARFPQCSADAQPPVGMVILGGVVDLDVSEARGQIAVSDSAERLTVALGFAQKYPTAKIIVSSGNANLIDQRLREADYMANFLKELGISEGRITVERQSRNTIENAEYAMHLAHPQAGERWLLITSAAHMPRAVGVFRKVGFDIVPCPVDYQTSGWSRVVDMQGGFLSRITRLDAAAHEWIGLLAYRVAGKVASLFPGP